MHDPTSCAKHDTYNQITEMLYFLGFFKPFPIAGNYISYKISDNPEHHLHHTEDADASEQSQNATYDWKHVKNEKNHFSLVFDVFTKI